MKTKENSGITIIALSVTIIVMIVLAGVTISTLSGEDGIIQNANKAKIEQKISEFEEAANLIYSEKYMEKYLNGEDVSIKDLTKDLEEKGYKINQVIADRESQKEIILNQEIITLGLEESKKVTIKSDYYVEIYSKNYEIKIKNEKINVDRDNFLKKKELENDISVSSNSTNLEVTTEGYEILLKDKGNVAEDYTITINCGQYSKEYNVSVIKRPVESEENNNLNMQTDYGKIDIIWVDKENNVIEEPNEPVLTSNGESMTPIIWDNGKITSIQSSNVSWYNYNRKKWANAKTANDSYFVWIPRYAYRIAYYSDETYSELTGIYDGLGVWNVKTGEKRENIGDGIKVINYNGDKYIVHPAFGTDLELGGWSEELAGIWFAKFEISQDENELKSTYGVKSIRDQNIGEQYNMARQGRYGFTGKTDEDEYASYMNSHMTKNSEWGAVAYLTESRFGTSGKNIEKCTEDDYTGGGAGEKYIEKAKQSTTGNVYGIYDFVGGALERMACFNSVDKNRNLRNYGWTEYTKLTNKSSSTKYATKYNNKSNTYDSYDYNGRETIFQYAKIGDATKEVRKWEQLGWNDETINILYPSNPFIVRSGAAKESEIGVFYSQYSNGESDQYITFRTVLCP